MIQTLIMLRHAKSDWGKGVADLERPLSQRGRRSAKAMGRFLASAGLVPDLALTSPATRARSTLEIAAESGAWGCRIRVAESLHGAAEDVLAEIGRTEGSVSRLLVVGHQPTWSEVAANLTGCSAIGLPTGSALVLGSDAEGWDGFIRLGGAIELLITPKALLGR